MPKSKGITNIEQGILNVEVQGNNEQGTRNFEY